MSHPTSAADVIVVGLGAFGSAATWQLTRRGLRVVGVDRHSPPHSLGSTHGESRVTRQACAEGAQYVPLAIRSQQLWREIERETGDELFGACGVLMAGPASGAGASLHGTPRWLERTIELARRFDVEHELLDGVAARDRFPAFALADDDVVYLEPGGGYVRPERAVAAQLALAERAGATLHRDTQVRSIDPDGSGVAVTTDAGTLRAERVVLCAGAWLPTLLGGSALAARLVVSRQVLHWFAVDPDRTAHVSPGACPVFLWTFGDGDGDFFYGFPTIEGPDAGIKVATEQFRESTTADRVERSVASDEAAEMYERCVRGRLPAATPRHLRSAVCMYTSTPDANFAVGPHPTIDGVTVVSACSGHGFKHSAAIGEALAEQLVDGRSRLDLDPFLTGIDES